MLCTTGQAYSLEDIGFTELFGFKTKKKTKSVRRSGALESASPPRVVDNLTPKLEFSCHQIKAS